MKGSHKQFACSSGFFELKRELTDSRGEKDKADDEAPHGQAEANHVGEVILHGSLQVAVEVEAMLRADVVSEQEGAAHEGELFACDDVGVKLALEAEPQLLQARQAAPDSLLPNYPTQEISTSEDRATGVDSRTQHRSKVHGFSVISIYI